MPSQGMRCFVPEFLEPSGGGARLSWSNNVDLLAIVIEMRLTPPQIRCAYSCAHDSGQKRQADLARRTAYLAPRRVYATLDDAFSYDPPLSTDCNVPCRENGRSEHNSWASELMISSSSEGMNRRIFSRSVRQCLHPHAGRWNAAIEGVCVY